MRFHVAPTLGGSPVGFACTSRTWMPVSLRRRDRCDRERPVQDQFYGDRSGTVTDPFGHIWTIATHIEDVPEPR